MINVIIYILSYVDIQFFCNDIDKLIFLKSFVNSYYKTRNKNRFKLIIQTTKYTP